MIPARQRLLVSFYFLSKKRFKNTTVQIVAPDVPNNCGLQ
jgi:hypothetical protein